ncbi:MAG: TrkH family potassium uptake protein [Candidatus Krumholzibacteriia bacterium]
MRTTVVARYLGLIVLLAAAGMALSALVDLLSTGEAVTTLLVAAALIGCFGVFPMVFVPAADALSARESLAVAVGGWIVLGIASALPYVLWGAPFDLIDALFESFSGLTTTGASILEQIEVLPAGLVFWRSLTHWIGGVGIIVLALAVLPSFTGLGLGLFRSERSQVSPAPGAVRTSDLTRILLAVYCGLTLLETIALVLVGMPLFDAITNSFGTIATGGFCPRDGSIAAYDSLAVELVIIVFMTLSGVNFAYMYGFLLGRRSLKTGQTTVVVYLSGLVVGTGFVALDIHRNVYPTVSEALRHAAFQVISINTSTGFASADSSLWPGFSQAWLVIASLVGACAGSTSGAMKMDRLVLIYQQARNQLRKMEHPRAVQATWVDGSPVSETQVMGAAVFVGAYLMIVALATLLVAVSGAPIREAFTGTVACMGNIGPGFGAVGSLGHYNSLADAAKLVLAAVMLIGRVEIYGILLLATPGFWQDG